LAIAALLACITPAGARLSSNAVAQNGIFADARIMSSALGDLNGVAVEGVIVPDAATR
jgi:hypothetical protein